MNKQTASQEPSKIAALRFLDERPWLLVPLALVCGLLLGLPLLAVPNPGYDWMSKLTHNVATTAYFPPWAAIVIWPLASLPSAVGLSLMAGITLSVVAWTTYYQGRQQADRWLALGIVLALFNPQTLTEYITGNFAALSLIAIWGLPWLAPVVLMRSTYVAFSVITRKDAFLVSLAFGILSLIIWPGWPAAVLSSMPGRNIQLAAGGWLRTGWPAPLAGAVLLLLSDRRDIFQNMAAGAFVYPFLMPYHSMVLLPVMGEMKGTKLILAWLAGWLAVVPPIVGTAYELYLLLPLAIWIFRRSSQLQQETWLAFLLNRFRKTTEGIS